MIVSKEMKKLREENRKLKEKLKDAKYINTGILRRWKENYKKKLKKDNDMKFECEFLLLDSLVKGAIKECEGKHVQQIAYSSYHDALTQICFGCRKIRTSLKEEDVNVLEDKS